jgi:hypothetical protein
LQDPVLPLSPCPLLATCAASLTSVVSVSVEEEGEHRREATPRGVGLQECQAVQ